MTEKEPEVHVEEDEDELDSKLNYKPPPQKTLQELQELDKDDESLAKYKKTLLGDGPVVAGMAQDRDRHMFVSGFATKSKGGATTIDKCIEELLSSQIEIIQKNHPTNVGMESYWQM